MKKGCRMRWARIIFAMAIFPLGLPGQLGFGNSDDNQIGKARSPVAAIAIWDTGKPADEPLSSTTIAKKEGWSQIPTKPTETIFNGDAGLGNGRVGVVLRKGPAASRL